MNQVATITSQGQITIPSVFRKKLGLQDGRPNKVYISISELTGKITLEPVRDLTKLAGIISNRAFKNKNDKEISKIEKSAMSMILSDKYKSSSNK